MLRALTLVASLLFVPTLSHAATSAGMPGTTNLLSGGDYELILPTGDYGGGPFSWFFTADGGQDYNLTTNFDLDLNGASDFASVSITSSFGFGGTLGDFIVQDAPQSIDFTVLAGDTVSFDITFTDGSDTVKALALSVLFLTEVVPVPGPATLPLLGGGLLAFGALRRRRKVKSAA